jgi:hypothetical protein
MEDFMNKLLVLCCVVFASFAATSWQGNNAFPWAVSFRVSEKGVVTTYTNGELAVSDINGTAVQLVFPARLGGIASYSEETIAILINETDVSYAATQPGQTATTRGLAPSDQASVREAILTLYKDKFGVLPPRIQVQIRKLGRFQESSSVLVDLVIQYNAAQFYALHYPTNEQAKNAYLGLVAPGSRAEAAAQKMLGQNFLNRPLSGSGNSHQIRIVEVVDDMVKTVETTSWYSGSVRRFQQSDKPHTYVFSGGRIADDDFK